MFVLGLVLGVFGGVLFVQTSAAVLRRAFKESLRIHTEQEERRQTFYSMDLEMLRRVHELLRHYHAVAGFMPIIREWTQRLLPDRLEALDEDIAFVQCSIEEVEKLRECCTKSPVSAPFLSARPVDDDAEVG